MADINTTSKFLSLILRHQPGAIGLALDENGWAEVKLLLEKMALHGHSVSFEQLKTIVDTNDKKRFVFSADHRLIRASQGHSIDVDLQLIETSTSGHSFPWHSSG